jgi:hypothetical protein
MLPLLPSLQSFNQVLKNNSAVFTMGEYYLTKPYDQAAEWLGDRLNSGALHSSLHVPMMYATREVFMKRSAPMALLPYVRKQFNTFMPERVPVSIMRAERKQPDPTVAFVHCTKAGNGYPTQGLSAPNRPG